jgi:hypothetical protein
VSVAGIGRAAKLYEAFDSALVCWAQHKDDEACKRRVCSGQWAVGSWRLSTCSYLPIHRHGRHGRRTGFRTPLRPSVRVLGMQPRRPLAVVRPSARRPLIIFGPAETDDVTCARPPYAVCRIVVGASNTIPLEMAAVCVAARVSCIVYPVPCTLYQVSTVVHPGAVQPRNLAPSCMLLHPLPQSPLRRGHGHSARPAHVQA